MRFGATVRWYRRILRLYPRELRRRHGDEMVEVVRRRWRRVRGETCRRRLAFALHTWGAALAQGVASWHDLLRRRWREDRGRGRRSSAPGHGGRTDRSRRAVANGLAASGDPLGDEDRPVVAMRRSRAAAGQASSARLAGLAGDLRLAARSLLRTPGFTAVAVVTLALGIGATTAIFGIVETVLLDPLPYPASERLMVMDGSPWTPTEIAVELQRRATSVEAVAGYYPRQLAITGEGGEPVELEGAGATAGFLEVLGADVVLGRGFRPDDAAAGAPPVALVAHGLWQRRHGGSPEVLGREIRIDGTPYRIIGVVEPGFRQILPRSDDPQVWVPLPMEASETFTTSSLTSNWMIPVVRLGAGMAPAAAQAELDAVTARFRERHGLPGEGSRWHLRFTPVRSTLVADVRPALLLLQLAVGVVLLLACVNVANLMLVRAGSRQRELAVRAALGASRWQIVRLLLAESLVLALLGGAAALAPLLVGLDVLVALAPADVPRIADVSVDPTVLLFTLGVSLTTGLLFGTAPALMATRGRLAGRLGGGGARTATGSLGRRTVSKALVVAEVTMTLVLLVAAGLLARSLVALAGQEPGFRTGGVVTAPFRVAVERYGTVSELEAFLQRVRERVAAMPAIEGAAVTNNLPIERGSATREFQPETAAGAADDGSLVAQYGVVSPGYFRVLEIPLLRGRAFDDADRRGGRPVAVVDEAMARATWPGRDPLGRRLRLGDDAAWRTVVGVVGDIRGGGLDEAPRPGVYIPYLQRPPTTVELASGRNAVLLVRSRLSAAELADPLRRAVQDVDPRQPLSAVVSLDDVLARGVSPQRFRALLLGAFAAVALLLAVSGIYGVVTALVGERTREFGIRLAMGAAGRHVLAGVLGQGLRLTALGVAFGLLAVLALGRTLSSLLYAVTPTDPMTVGGSVVVIVVVALTSCLVPAVRAMRLDPVEALRSRGRPDG